MKIEHLVGISESKQHHELKISLNKKVMKKNNTIKCGIVCQIDGKYKK